MWHWFSKAVEVTKIGDEELRASSALHEQWAKVCVVAVVAGLLVEVTLAAWHPSYDSSVSRWGSVVADAFVALGVFGEFFFSKRAKHRQQELDRRSNEKVAAAQVEIERLRAAHASRALTKEQYEALQTLKGNFSSVVITSVPTFEAMQFGRQIAHALESVGIDAPIAMPRIGMPWTNVYLVLPTRTHEDIRKEPLLQAFQLAGISTGCGYRSEHPMIDLPADVPIIKVGEKHSRSDTPPYTAYLHWPQNRLGAHILGEKPPERRR